MAGKSNAANCCLTNVFSKCSFVTVHIRMRILLRAFIVTTAREAFGRTAIGRNPYYGALRPQHRILPNRA